MATVSPIRGRRQLTAVTLGVALAALVVGPVPTASATGAAAGPASCMGHEASNLSPPGSSPEESPRGMRDFNAFFRETFSGTPSGHFISSIAGLREGSHAQCDEAIDELLGG